MLCVAERQLFCCSVNQLRLSQSAVSNRTIGHQDINGEDLLNLWCACHTVKFNDNWNRNNTYKSYNLCDCYLNKLYFRVIKRWRHRAMFLMCRSVSSKPLDGSVD